MEYNFTLRYQVGDDDGAHDELVERLGAAGCTDAVVGIGVPGRIALEFTREAVSASEAICSALAEVKGAISTVRLIEVAPDLVGLSDVALLVGVSRQYMRKLMVGDATDSPAPVHEGSAMLWHLADVLVWLGARGTWQADQTVLDVAQVAMQVNLVRELRRLAPGIERAVREELLT